STTSPGEVNLLFTSGRTTNEKLVTWSSTDETVFKVMNNTPYSITAIGAGHAKLQVEVQEIGSSEDPETDEIDVYVKPRMQLGTYNNPLTDGTYDKLQNQTVELAKGDYVSVANLQDNTTVETNKDFQPIDEKIQWVIYQQKGSKNYLVSDSTGKPVDGYDEKDAKFEYLPSLTLKNGDLNAYQFTGRAGTYYVRFFPYGVWDRTYIDQISQLEGMFGFTATVQSAFKDTEITLNVGGSYNLSDALGIPEAILKSTDFTITSISQKPTGVVTNNANPAVLQASSTDEGDAVFQITRVANAYGEIPGVSNTAFVDDAANDAAPEGNKSRINITVHVRESFRINTSKTIMYTGQTLQLAGVFGTGTMPKGSTFRWDIAFADTTSAKPEDYLKLTPAEREDDPNAEVEALQETPRGNPLIVKLYWTSLEGITQLATCEITITESATEIKIDNDDPIRIGVGESVNVSVTTNYGDYKGLVWLSSDETIFHLDEEDEGERVRKITADKVGEAILLVMNPDNNTTTTHKVIVTQAMTDLKIKEGDTTVEMARGFLQLHAEWKPEDATSTEVKWLIAGDASVASIDQEGMLRFGGTPGSVTVTVTSTNNPTQLSDSCTVTITATQITNIELTESEITVIKGTTHQLVAKITPEDPYDKTLTWESQDITGKVSVDQNGLVTANEVGDATVTVYGGLAKPVSVLVHVTEKLESIAFDQSEYTVQVGKTVDMRVLFTPAENVNMEVTFTSTNTDIATVEKKVENGITAGVVTGVKVGDVMMIVTSTELGLEGAVSCMVHVIEPIIVADEFAVDPEKKTIKEGETFEITPVFTPANPTDQTVQ
ncbi:MAG: Ig-like domain-containing protein, partial [Lachnospiraceae bacterium]|nr:Ig-like domain-containing protein [Lachnospiraceae bacterium]